MARKKIVFVIVEGPSDDDAIGYFLDKLFDKNTVYVQVMHCDITTQNGAQQLPGRGHFLLQSSPKYAILNLAAL